MKPMLKNNFLKIEFFFLTLYNYKEVKIKLNNILKINCLSCRAKVMAHHILKIKYFLVKIQFKKITKRTERFKFCLLFFFFFFKRFTLTQINWFLKAENNSNILWYFFFAIYFEIITVTSDNLHKMEFIFLNT